MGVYIGRYENWEEKRETLSKKNNRMNKENYTENLSIKSQINAERAKINTG
jgi:hypothetical protein